MTASPVFTMRRMFIVGLLTVVWLVLIDISINIFFVMPKSPMANPTKLQSYFDYGRSVEGKLRRMIGRDKESTALLAYSGWLTEVSDQQPVTASSPGQILIAAYGQSFTNQICKALKVIDPRFELRLKAGPAAPLSHSYALHKVDSNHQKADIVVLGILASSLPLMMAPTVATINFEGAAPYTYPIFSLKNGQLSEGDPIIHSLEELRVALRDNPNLWNKYLEMLRTKAPTYNGWVFESDWFDYSALARLIRRSFGQKHVHDVTARYWNTNGFTNADGLLDISNALIADFVSDVKSRGQIPYVLLIQDNGYKDHLALAFEAQLKRLDVPYLSTHTIAPSTNARNFISDGHFTPEITTQIARAFRTDVLNKLQREPSPRI